LANRLAVEAKVSPVLAQCLLNRGLSEPGPVQRFLEPRLQDLADPFLLPAMKTAVDRLLRARERREPLVIFGDYDVDGVTATALLTEVLEAFDWQVTHYLPHRLDEGYGLSQEAVVNCLEKHPVALVLAVDCGSTAVGAIDWLRTRGVDVIVLDHHLISIPAPAANALVNPHASSGALFGELCSVGLAFKLAHALVKLGRQTGLAGAERFDLRRSLDLVALGTIADLVPLTGENRVLVTAGLERLNKTERPGLQALQAVAQVNRRLGPYEVGFQLAPRLNAAGRLENAEAALQLLLARDVAAAKLLAEELDTQNRERQNIERAIAESVIAQVRSRFDPARDYVIVEGQLLWHVGVVGIVAARVLREFYRPTIILGGDNYNWRGSGRSIEGFDLAAALRECSDLLVHHGGHAMAAGLSIEPENLDAFRQRLNSLARRTLRLDQLQPTLKLDAEVAPGELTFELVEQLEQLQPTGQKNPPAQFVSRRVSHRRPPLRLGREQQHAKLWVTDGTTTHEAVWWGVRKADLPSGFFDLAFIPQISEFNGRRYVQLRVLDWQPAG
jgi:single-stranded-DNA-specific exonuclease